MTVNTKQLRFILENTPAEQNIMLVGKHGIGKSRILEEYFSQKGEKVVTLFLGQMSDPGDLIGLPEKNEKTGKTDFMLPYWFPTDDKPIVLFLDELNRARPEVLQTIMDLTLNRKLAGKKLPQGSRIISAVNNGLEYQLTDLDPALVSRFNIYEFSPTVENWLEWAESSNLDFRVIEFIKENPEYLDSEESSEDNLERSPDRRSWERTSNIIKKIQILSNDHLALLSGIVGNKAASLFVKFTNEKNIIPAKKVLTDFENSKAEIEKLSVVEMIQINKSLFKFLENSITEVESKVLQNNNIDSNTIDKNLECEKQLQTYANNLNKYFDYLTETKKTEIQSQLISLCSADEYPETLVFITKYCGALYSKIMKCLNV